MIHISLQIQQVATKPHLRIAEDRDRGPSFARGQIQQVAMKPHLRIAEDRDAREPVSQKMIYCRADFFIIRSSRDACDASVCICPRVAYFSNAPGPICRVLPWCFHLQDQVQKMNEIRLRGCFANGGGQMLQFGVRHFH